MAYALKKFANAFSSDASKLTKLTFNKIQAGGTTQDVTSPKQGAHRLTDQKYMRCHSKLFRKSERK